MRYCERCGVTFLWTAEEQHQQVDTDSPRPDRCPGCRLLLAGPGRERGVVKWYNTRKKYGFLTRGAGSEIFTHRSRFDGVGRLQPGDLVEFAVEEGEKGLMAVEVQLLQRGE
ncbi:MAG: cold shock domain-containing protein [Caldilineaceae bacterium]|nr:cold shock domain-containing protein [Caldilineaceae bacterium]